MMTHTQQHARSEYHTQQAKMSFDETFDLTAGGVYTHFFSKRHSPNVYENTWKVYPYTTAACAAGVATGMAGRDSSRYPIAIAGTEGHAS